MITSHYQKGLSLISLIITFIVLIMVVILGFKLIPPYMQYFTVKRMLQDMSSTGELEKDVVEIRRSFDKRAMVEYLNANTVHGEDLDIEKDNNNITVTASWSNKIPLVSNVSLNIDFSTSVSKHL